MRSQVIDLVPVLWVLVTTGASIERQTVTMVTGPPQIAARPVTNDSAGILGGSAPQTLPSARSLSKVLAGIPSARSLGMGGSAPPSPPRTCRRPGGLRPPSPPHDAVHSVSLLAWRFNRAKMQIPPDYRQPRNTSFANPRDPGAAVPFVQISPPRQFGSRGLLSSPSLASPRRPRPPTPPTPAIPRVVGLSVGGGALLGVSAPRLTAFLPNLGDRLPADQPQFCHQIFIKAVEAAVGLRKSIYMSRCPDAAT